MCDEQTKHGSIMLAVLVLWLGAGGAQAHQPGESYLNLTFEESRVVGQWDIALRDLDAATGWTPTANGEITYEELQSAQKTIAAYALARWKSASTE